MSLTELSNIVKQSKRKTILFVGLGNKDRGDDRAGIYIVENLQRNILSKYREEKNIKFLIVGTVPENYLQKIIDIQPQIIIFIDSTYMNENPGKIKLIPTDSINSLCISTHTSSISLIISYLKHSIDAEVYLIGIQPESCQYGQGLSLRIMENCNELIESLLTIL